MIADQSGCRLLAARVHDGDHVHVFVSTPPKVSIPELVRVFKCISAKCFSQNFRSSENNSEVGICGHRVTL
jgi:REP element-mobilizing transposase RayT